MKRCTNFDVASLRIANPVLKSFVVAGLLFITSKPGANDLIWVSCDLTLSGGEHPGGALKFDPPLQQKVLADAGKFGAWGFWLHVCMWHLPDSRFLLLCMTTDEMIAKVRLLLLVQYDPGATDGAQCEHPLERKGLTHQLVSIETASRTFA